MNQLRIQHRPSPRKAKAGSTLWLRLSILAAMVAIVAGTVYALWPKMPESPANYDQKMTVSMAGFNPGKLELRAGAGGKIWLVNPDSAYHTDGGGVHGFTVPELGIDAKVDPKSTLLVDIPATVGPGEYRFYCDTCCGGKDNPLMNGVLRVSA